MAVGDKAWALNQLRHGRQSYLYTLASMRLLNSPATEALAGRRLVLKDSGFIWDPDPADRVGRRFEFEADQLVSDYKRDQANFSASLNELYKFVRRNVFTEAYEVVKTYSTSAGILPA